MSEVSSGTALSRLNQAQNAMRKVRKAMPLVRDGSLDAGRVIASGWESLRAAHRVLSEIPLGAANDEVMTRQIAVQRYATALLVRLRRLARKGPEGLDGLDEETGDDEE